MSASFITNYSRASHTVQPHRAAVAVDSPGCISWQYNNHYKQHLPVSGILMLRTGDKRGENR